MRGFFRGITLSLALVAAGAGLARAEGEYINECMARGIEQARQAGNYTGYGFPSNQTCVVGGWVKRGESMDFGMNFKAGKRYLVIGAGDRDVPNLDISVKVQPNGKSYFDQDVDNTPWIHVDGIDKDCTVVVKATNNVEPEKMDGTSDFCVFFVLVDGGREGSFEALMKAGRELTNAVVAEAKKQNYSSDPTVNVPCLFGGLFEQGEQQGIIRPFGAGRYLIVGWSDDLSRDLDLQVEENNRVVDRDEMESAVPWCDITVSGDTRLVARMRMTRSEGPAFAMCAILAKK